ncbi:MAG: PAS domain S-box protein [Labilithrix sp.]|nr:PAS domain S-box protein [Labilithrix sp.]MCW5814610.1 PAS domain S-box protein [Labilithrix sp.]
MAAREGVDPWDVLEALPQPVVVLGRDGEVRYRNAAAIAAGIVAPGEPAGGEAFAVEARACGDGTVFVYRDVTAARKTEADLASLSERFRTLVDGSPDIVFITDASSRMTYANAALEEQTGYTVGDFQMPQAENRLIHPEDQARVAAFLAEFVASGRKYSGPLRNRFVARDGRVLWYSSVVSRSEYAGEPVLQFVVHNITAEEAAREELARVQEQLVKQERLAALGELAASVAHEIRNPVSIIYNALTSLRRAPPAADANMLLGIVEDEAARLQRTVRDLLDFTRPLAPSFEPRDLVGIAKEAVAAVDSERPAGCAVRVSYDAGDAPFLADVDRDMIHRAVVNLVANAFQAMPNGGELAIELTRRATESTTAIELAVVDSGAGIASDNAARIFEPFFTTRATGTGLGLALVKRIVASHGGTVIAGSGPTGGARFVVSLPARQVPPSSAPASSAPASGVGRGASGG